MPTDKLNQKFASSICAATSRTDTTDTTKAMTLSLESIFGTEETLYEKGTGSQLALRCYVFVHRVVICTVAERCIRPAAGDRRAKSISRSKKKRQRCAP